MENKSKNIALYARVSTNKQTNENQILSLKKYAADKNLTFDLYEEVESTRKTRPVKASLMHKLRNGEYSALVVYKLDRFARSFTELILDVDELVKKDVGFISISEQLDFSTATGQLHFRILSAFANFERDLISARTKEGIARAKQQGKILGRPKGAKDTKPRPKSGYYMREANKRKLQDESSGTFKGLESYVK